MINKVNALNFDELEQVSGGAIVDTGSIDRTGRYVIVDDKTGETRFTVNSKNTAEQLAFGTYKTGTEMITPEEYEARFGRPFQK